VCARGGGGLLRERMALAAALWAAGIRTELLPAAAPSSTAQYEYARAAGIPWMVTLNAATFSAADTVVVSSVLEIAPNKHNHHPLVPYLRSRQYCLGVSLSTRACLLSKLLRAQQFYLCGMRISQVKNLERKGAEEESVLYADVARFLQVTLQNKLHLVPKNLSWFFLNLRNPPQIFDPDVNIAEIDTL